MTTPEIEEVLNNNRKETLYDSDNANEIADDAINNFIIAVLPELTNLFHHQLQKAREEERNSYRFDIEGKMYLVKELVKHIEHHDKLNASFERGRVNAFEEMLLTLKHSELDQDNNDMCKKCLEGMKPGSVVYTSGHCPKHELDQDNK